MFKRIILSLITVSSLSSCYLIVPPPGVYNYSGHRYYHSHTYYYPHHLPPPKPKPCYGCYR